MKGKAMLQAAAYLETANGQKYLVQLCKHFAHKIEVSYSENHAECQFASGVGCLDSDGSGLRMTVNAADGDGLAQIQSIIETHLVRFAFREAFEALEWRRLDPAA
jgi:hypothetical protein